MLYIDPATCIDCGACIDVCPVDAISEDYRLTGDIAVFEQLADLYFAGPTQVPAADERVRWLPPVAARIDVGRRPRVAVVGSGPAGMYAVAGLLEAFDEQVDVDLVEALPTPGGLIRYGVAPDHPNTKQVSDVLESIMSHPNVVSYLGIAVGPDISHDELMRTHDAVLYAVGAPRGRQPALPGVDLAGSLAASDLVGWYNGHPDQAETELDFSGADAVIIGNGNVALDVARILTASADELARTDISPVALAALAESRIRTVTILGRRGPEDAAFTTSELYGLLSSPSRQVRARDVETVEGKNLAPLQRHRVELLRALESHDDAWSGRVVEFRFRARPLRVLGAERVSGIEVDHVGTDGESARTDVLACGLLVSAVGHEREVVPGVPQRADGTVHHEAGRLIHPRTGAPVPGVYGVGWFKRGPSGQIGDNKACARETVRSLLEDLHAGRLSPPQLEMGEVVPARGHTGVAGWRAIDAFERSGARGSDAPRRKVIGRDAMDRIARSATESGARS
jgi:ferredoxin--NADP+ reductase